MPKLIEIDGEEVEVYTADEIAELTKKATDEEAAKMTAELNSQLTAKEEEWLKEKEELEQAINPNWREARQKMSLMEKKLKALEGQGKTLDDDGNVVDLNKGLTEEDVDRRAREIVESTIIKNRISQELSGFKDDEKTAILSYYNKLSAGEEVNMDNIGTFLENSIKLAQPEKNENPIMDRISRSGSVGFNPSQSVKRADFAETTEGQGLAEQMGIEIK